MAVNEQGEPARGERTATPQVLRISVLGPLAVEWAEGTFPPERMRGRGSARALGLLKALLSQADRFATRDWLMEQFWPDSAISSAQERLDDVASGLRTLLRPPGSSANFLHYVHGSDGKGSGYRLEGYPRLWVDADAFCWLVEQAARLDRFGQDSLPLWEQAYHLGARGPFLPEERYSDWAQARRELLAGHYRQCVHRLASILRERGASEQALLRLRTYWQAHLTDEDVLRPLMELLGEQEQYQEAEDAYQQLMHTLTEDGHQRDPDERTRDLCEYLRTKQLRRVPEKTALHDLQLPVSSSTSTDSDGTRNEIFVLPSTYAQQYLSPEKVIPDCATRVGLILAQMIALIEKWYGMALFCHELQNQLDQNIKALDTFKTQYSLDAFTLSRRSFLITLAALPTAFLASSKQAHKIVLNLEEFLPQCSASVTACWHLSGGNNLEAIVPILDSYVPTLITVVKNVPLYREVVAGLVAQCFFLKTILAWHTEGLASAEKYCLQALYYGDIAKNINLRLTALNQHALISYYGKQFSKALAKSEEAYEVSRQATHEQVLPIVQGRVCMYLSAIQAQQFLRQTEQTLEQAQKAFALQATHADAIPLYADCGNAPLALWEGLTHYHLSQHGSGNAVRALEALQTYGHLQPNINIPERFRLECLNNRTLAAILSSEIDEAIACFEAGTQGARALGSKQRNTEIEYAYLEMRRRWPKEQRIQELEVLANSLKEKM